MTTDTPPTQQRPPYTWNPRAALALVPPESERDQYIPKGYRPSEWHSHNAGLAVRDIVTTIGWLGRYSHGPILFKNQWTGIIEQSGRLLGEGDEGYHHVGDMIQFLESEVVACEADTTRAWRRFPVAIFSNAIKFLRFDDLATVADGRTFVDAWRTAELREHAFICDMYEVAHQLIAQAIDLTTRANALRDDGEDDAALIAEYGTLVEAAYEFRDWVITGNFQEKLRDDPNLLTMVVGATPARTLELAAASQGSLNRLHWSLLLRPSGEGTLTLRNVVRAYQPVSGATMTPASIAVSATSKGVSIATIALPADAVVGTYIATIDHTPTGAANPAASVTVEMVLKPPPAAPSNLSARAGDGEATIYWDDPSNADIAKYQVRTSDDAGATWGEWADVAGSSATTVTATITDLTNGTTYAVELRAVDKTNTPGAASTVNVRPTSDGGA